MLAMQLSPLQSRLAASLLASCLLILLYLTLFTPHFASAAELSPKSPMFVLDDISVQEPTDAVRIRQPEEYEPEFAAFDRSIIGRAPAGVTSLSNNVPAKLNLDPGTTQVFVFEKATILGRTKQSEALELRGEQDASQGEARSAAGRSITDGEPIEERDIVKRQATKTVFFSANTCMQPQLKPDATAMEPPQLTMFVSTSPRNTSPGPKAADQGAQTFRVFTEGAIMVNMTASDDIYIGISAPNVSTEFFQGTYNFQVAASIDGWYHSYDEQMDANLIWVDSDATTALLMTHNLTESDDPDTVTQMMTKQPYVMFAQNEKDTSIDGVRFSYCGLQNYAQVAATKNGRLTSMVSTDITRRGQGNKLKQQFYFSGLNASTNYLGILAANGNAGTAGDNVIGGGGHVARATTFQTKRAGGNCEVVFNLEFCNETAWAVPSNPNRFDTAALAKLYDDYAKSMYDTFKKALAQIPCEAPSTQRYSLARNCADCEAAYKTWLCAVALPRCEDFSNTDAFLLPRAIGQPFPDNTTLDAPTLTSLLSQPLAPAYNASRNRFIDAQILPGPYKEVLPCDDLCYSLVQSCPSALKFGCPTPGTPGFETSYRQRSDADRNGSVTCNYPGSAHLFSGAPPGLAVEWMTLITLGSLAALLLL